MTRDYDALTDRKARAILRDLYEAHPELVEAVTSSTLIASPGAGPIRILREVDGFICGGPEA